MELPELHYKNCRWINLPNPSPEEVSTLKENFPFHPLNLDVYLTKTQSPKFDIYRFYSLFVLDFPYLPPESDKISIGEVDFFIGDDYVVTLHDDKLPALGEIFRRCQSNEKTLQRFLGKGPIFLFYRLADILIDSSFPILDRLSSRTEHLDREILGQAGKDILSDISIHRRNIVYFQTLVKPTLPIFEKLEKGEIERLNGGMQNYWSNLYDHLQKIWERLEDLRELNEGLSATYESLLSYRTNEIIKILTIFSAIVLPLNLIASFYGMNIVGLPFSQHHLIAFGITTLMWGLAVLMIIYFKFRKWF